MRQVKLHFALVKNGPILGPDWSWTSMTYWHASSRCASNAARSVASRLNSGRGRLPTGEGAGHE